MSLLPIVERELRVTARRAATYWMRFFLALLVLLIWLFMLSTDHGPFSRRGQTLFVAIGVLTLIFCLFSGIFLAADSLSQEKREGTLGLLFLTDLKGYDVVLGKLVANSLHAFYGLLGVLPLLGLSLLLGGVSGEQFWRINLVLILTLFYSLSISIFVSSFCHDTRRAMVLALLILVTLAGLLPAIWALQRWLGSGVGWNYLLWPCPVNLFINAFDAAYSSRYGASLFWNSLATILGLSLFALLTASLYLPRSFQEEKRTRSEKSVGWRELLNFGSPAFRAWNRKRLSQNPYLWLASRDRSARWLGLLILLPLLLIWFCFFASCFSNNTNTNRVGFVVCLLMAFGSHQVFKWIAAFEASRQLNEDRTSGALEALLVTPIAVEQIISGQNQALKELLRKPMLLVLLMNLGLLYLIMMDPLRMSGSDRSMFVQFFAGGALMLLADFAAIRWTGMSLALLPRRHTRVIFETLVRVSFTPWLIAILGFFATVSRVRMNNNDVIGLWFGWFCIGFSLDLALGSWAGKRLHRELRKTDLRVISQASLPAMTLAARRLEAESQ